MFEIPNKKQFEDTSSIDGIRQIIKKDGILDTSTADLQPEDKQNCFKLKKKLNPKKVGISIDKNL